MMICELTNDSCFEVQLQYIIAVFSLKINSKLMVCKSSYIFVLTVLPFFPGATWKMELQKVPG